VIKNIFFLFSISTKLRDKTQKCLDKEDQESIEGLTISLDLFSLLIEVDEFFASAFKNQGLDVTITVETL
jgi:hypothetical protein